MQNDVSAPLIDAEHAAFMLGGVSLTAAGCGAGNRPSQSRATGCRLAPDRRQVTLFFSASQASQLLADIRANGRIAAVFSLPSTHRTVQLKGRDAAVTLPQQGDLQIVEQYRDAFVRLLEPFGYAPPLIRTLLACAPEDLVAVTFTPDEAFSQTPGPQAGTPLRMGA